MPTKQYLNAFCVPSRYQMLHIIVQYCIRLMYLTAGWCPDGSAWECTGVLKTWIRKVYCNFQSSRDRIERNELDKVNMTDCLAINLHLSSSV